MFKLNIWANSKWGAVIVENYNFALLAYKQRQVEQMNENKNMNYEIQKYSIYKKHVSLTF